MKVKNTPEDTHISLVIDSRDLPVDSTNPYQAFTGEAKNEKQIINYKEMVANLKQARHTLKKLGFSPRTVTIGEFAEAVSNINEVIGKLNTARENGTK